jgi:hypothetical protein
MVGNVERWLVVELVVELGGGEKESNMFGRGEAKAGRVQAAGGVVAGGLHPEQNAQANEHCDPRSCPSLPGRTRGVTDNGEERMHKQRAHRPQSALLRKPTRPIQSQP